MGCSEFFQTEVLTIDEYSALVFLPNKSRFFVIFEINYALKPCVFLSLTRHQSTFTFSAVDVIVTKSHVGVCIQVNIESVLWSQLFEYSAHLPGKGTSAWTS